MKDSYIRKYGDKLLFILGISILVAILYNRQGEKPASVPIFQIAPVPTIQFTQWWEEDLETENLQSLINEFEALHEGIKVTLHTVSYEELREGLYSSRAPLESPNDDSNFPGDIIALDPLWIPDLLSQEIIEIPDTENAFIPMIERPFIDSPGSLLSSINVLYYNVDLLIEAGFARPPKTRGEFLTYLRTIKKNNENTPGETPGIVFGGKSIRFLNDDIFPWIWSAGIELIKNGKPECSSRAVIESLTFFAALHSEGLVMPDSFSMDSREKLERFTTGKAVFMIAPASEISRVRERMGDERFSVTSVPIPDLYAGKSFYGTAGWTVGINQASIRKEEARLLAAFLGEKRNELLGRAGASLQGQAQSDLLYSKVWDITIAGDPANDFSGLPWAGLEEIFREELTDLFMDKKNPAETAGSIQTRWEAVLKNLR